MSEEEKKAIEEDEIKFRAYLLILNSEFSTDKKAEAMKELLKIYNKQQKEIERLKEIIIAIRHELKGNVIVKDDNGYAPAKNLTKQEVYESYVKLNLLLKANYIFKEDEDVIKELLEE